MTLGEKAGLDHTYVGGIERAERNLSLEAIGKLAMALGIEIHELFRYTGRHATITDEHLSELVALLEREDTPTRRLALELVRVAVRHREKR